MVGDIQLHLALTMSVLESLQVLSLADWLQWIGAISGLAGAFVLARNNGTSKWGWFGFLGANLFIGGFAYLIGAHALLLQQIGFTITSLMGIWKADFVFLRRFQSGGRRPAAPSKNSMKSTTAPADRAPRRASGSAHRSQWHAL